MEKSDEFDKFGLINQINPPTTAIIYNYNSLNKFPVIN